MSNGEGDVVLDGTWMCSGWQFVLPQQATALHMLVATATDQDLDGSLDELLEDLGVVWFDYFTDGLDFPVRWTHPIDARDQVEVDAGERGRRECLAAFSLAGIVLQSTMRELATTMAELGIFTVSHKGCRWHTVAWPPMPEDALPVSQEFRDAEGRRRWLKLQEPNALRLLQVLPQDDLATTSIEELQRLTDLPAIAVRGGLELLVHDGALVLWQPNGDDADPERLPADMLVDLFLAFDPFDCAGDLE
jgi:hypothetical protein